MTNVPGDRAELLLCPVVASVLRRLARSGRGGTCPGAAQLGESSDAGGGGGGGEDEDEGERMGRRRRRRRRRRKSRMSRNRKRRRMCPEPIVLEANLIYLFAVRIVRQRR